MQFHIPQYIDIEDKIFGPFTLKQAVYLAGGAGGAYIFYKFIPWLFLSVPFIAGIGVLTWALAFYPERKLGRPFIAILEAGFRYSIKNKLYLWKKTAARPIEKTEEAYVSAQIPPPIPSVPRGRLSSASFDVDVKGPKEEKVGGGTSGFRKAASAEAGILSTESFALAQKIPQVNTFTATEKKSYSPNNVETAFLKAGMSSAQAKMMRKAMTMGKR